ncbi:MAG: hypothetical protein AAFN11_19995 [Chloroflexota bacterium]
MSKQDHRPKDETLALIVDVVANAQGGLTRTQIARALERTKTPHLIELIESLVDEGYLQRHIKIFGNGVEGYLYVLVDEG